ncbi:NAD(P)-binding protein [Aspergillus steynii IBT 23096]|uniref:NAD(P)-binding protein n=1 Tax=Aspergillus steynii IBT 23096 TaxID=1392250 RepID=A0A2I2GHU7_9EURO|nr:NAD(P)-binding protein [Aspergillus steynii IBT 23096]PLB52449.1 NAD(P)-binding protein [Aspergillus steynii IBT 23096]
MAEYYKDKLVVITGAASGIGKATALKLHALGANLIPCDINETSLTELQATLDPTRRHVYFAIDISSSTACTTVSDFITSNALKLDFLFNCAGINPTVIPITDTTDDYFSKLIDVNLRGTFNMTRACAPLMPAGSAIVNVSSICGLKGFAGYSVYCATKFGIIGLTKALAAEFGPKGIRVNAVAPGPIDTPTNDANVSGADAVKRAGEKVALGRMGEASEIADVVVFLFSEGSSYMNGAVVEVTGG